MKRPKAAGTLNRRENKDGPRLPNHDLTIPDRDELSKENLAEIGARRTKHDLEQHNSTGPVLTGGDLDADWQRAKDSGDEAVGGHAPTPDQNIVDELGKAVGFEAEEGEELRTSEERTAQRDRKRWELDRRSAASESRDGA